MSIAISNQQSGTGRVLLVLLILIFTAGLPAKVYPQQSSKQKKEQLQKQMKKLQDEIKLIESAIKANSAKKEKNMGELLSLQAKIKSREKLIDNMSNQISGLDQDIDSTQAQIDVQSIEVDKMKREYADMLRKSYENITLQSQAAFLLSSSSFFDAVRRYNYLQKIAEYRKSQARVLQRSIDDLQAKKNDLQDTKQQKQDLLYTQTKQKEELESEKKEKDDAVSKLLEKEKKLRKQADDKSKAAQQLNSRIQAIIEDEIRLAKKKAEEQAKKNPGSTNTPTIKKNEAIPMTPEERALSASFEKNMGKLPWPVLRGHIISEFGVHDDPLLKGVKRSNNGIDIKTEAGADARSVFGGTVISTFYLPTIQNCVIVKHGEYFSVYSNIETLSVKSNDEVTTKQPLGKLHTDKDEDLTKVHIEIWKGKDKLDPELWLAD